MSIERYVPRILEHVDVDRWERKALLLSLVARLACPPSPVEISPRMLTALSRTVRQARRDHAHLCELADDRVLIRYRAGGATPDCWRVRQDVSQWMHVPWLTPRRTVVREVLSSLRTPPESLRAISAGQGNHRGPPDPYFERLQEIWEELTRTFTPPRGSSMIQGGSSMIQRPGKTPPGGVLNDSADPDPVLVSDCSNEQSVLESTDGPTEEPPTGQSEAGAQLVAAVVQAVGLPIFGEPARRIRAIADRYPEHLDELVDFARSLTWVRKPGGAVKAMESWAPTSQPSPPPPDPEALARNLRQRIANLRSVAPDDERLGVLDAELAGMSNSDPSQAQG